MALWSTRRKLSYAAIAIVLIAIGVSVPAYLAFHTNPTCFDDTQNGDELGIDCGGSCTRLCSSSFVPIPPASWVRFVEAAPHYYNVAAYIVNPNPNAAALGLPYAISFLDKDGIAIATAKGTVSLPPGRNTLAFQAGVSTGIQTPVRAIIRYAGEPTWSLAPDRLSAFAVADKRYDEDASSSSLTLTLSNASVAPLADVTVFVVLRDADGTVLDFSKTIVDAIPGKGTAIAPFTWPRGHEGKVISIEVLPVAE